MSQLHLLPLRARNQSPDSAKLKVLKTVHLMASFCWCGGALALLVLAWLRETYYAHGAPADLINECIHFIDSIIVMPGILGCALTGLYYSIYASFGFTRYFWIGYKWLVSVNALFWGILFLGPWKKSIFALADAYGFRTLLTHLYHCIMPSNLTEASLQILLLISMIVVSVYRPVCLWNWKKYQHIQPRGLRHGRR